MRKIYTREEIIDEMKKEIVLASTHIDTLNELVEMIENNHIELSDTTISKIAEETHKEIGSGAE